MRVQYVYATAFRPFALIANMHQNVVLLDNPKNCMPLELFESSRPRWPVLALLLK